MSTNRCIIHNKLLDRLGNLIQDSKCADGGHDDWTGFARVLETLVQIAGESKVQELQIAYPFLHQGLKAIETFSPFKVLDIADSKNAETAA